MDCFRSLLEFVYVQGYDICLFYNYRSVLVDGYNDLFFFHGQLVSLDAPKLFCFFRLPFKFYVFSSNECRFNCLGSIKAGLLTSLLQI